MLTRSAPSIRSDAFHATPAGTNAGGRMRARTRTRFVSPKFAVCLTSTKSPTSNRSWRPGRSRPSTNANSPSGGVKPAGSTRPCVVPSSRFHAVSATPASSELPVHLDVVEEAAAGDVLGEEAEARAPGREGLRARVDAERVVDELVHAGHRLPRRRAAERVRDEVVPEDLQQHVAVEIHDHVEPQVDP